MRFLHSPTSSFSVITFLRFIKRGLICSHPIKNNSTFKNFQFTHLKTLTKYYKMMPFALFLTIISIQETVLGSLLTVRFRREADKDEIITISEAGKFLYIVFYKEFFTEKFQSFFRNFKVDKIKEEKIPSRSFFNLQGGNDKNSIEGICQSYPMPSSNILSGCKTPRSRKVQENGQIRQLS